MTALTTLQDFDPQGTPPAVPVTADGALTDYDARLIMDLVANLRSKSAILQSYGITVQDLTTKAASPIWAQAYRETVRVWQSDMNTKTRIQMKAAFLLEDSLVPLFAIVQNTQMSVSARLEAIEQLTKISTVATVPRSDVAGSERHNITINIGGDKPPVIITTQESSNG